MSNPPIVLTDDYMKGPAARVVPGAYYSREDRAWLLKDPTPRGAAVALKLFPSLSLEHPELVDIRASLIQDVRPFDNPAKYQFHVDAPRVRAALQAEGHDFYHFQDIDLGYHVAVLRQHGATYVGWDRGLGKTLGACALIDALECRRSLIVSPNTSKSAVWAPELERFCPWLEVVVLRNGKAQREKDLAHVRQLIEADIPFALVVHYEALSIIGDKRTPPRLRWKGLGDWDIVIADEAHRIANPKTQMARALCKVPAKGKVALSGSIIQNHPQEMYSPLHWMFPERYSSKWRDWNDRFLDYVEPGHGKVCVGVKIERLDDMRQELGVFMTYRRKEDELDLPPRTFETRLVDLSPAQERVYRELQDSCMAELEDGSFVVGTDGLTLLTRLRQVATGLDLLSGNVSDSSKADLALELIQDSPDDAFVVFSWYKAAASSFRDRLAAVGVDSFVVTGDVKQADRADYIRRFQAGEGRVFIGTIATLGESVTLHRASNAIFLDRSWNPGANAQAADRIYRIGQTKPVTITHIVARGTVDELRVQPVLADKSELRALILGGRA